MSAQPNEYDVEEARSAIFDILDEYLGPFVSKRLTDEVLDQVIVSGIIAVFDE